MRKMMKFYKRANRKLLRFFLLRSIVALRSLLATVYQQRQELQNTSVASCKFRRDGQRLLLRVRWVGF